MNILGRAYRRFGPRYPQTALVLAMQLEHVVFAIGVGMLALYVDMTLGEFVLLLVGAILAEVAYNVLAARYTRRRLEPMARWIAGGRDPSTTQSAWRAGVSLPLDLVRTRLQNPFPTLTALIWACFAVWLLGLSPWAVPLLVGLAVLAAIYAVALIFFLSELLLRPVLDDIGGAGAPVSGSAGQLSAPLLWRMLATLPAISVISGVVSAGLSKGAQSGVGSFALAVVVAIGVACTLALALS